LDEVMRASRQPASWRWDEPAPRFRIDHAAARQGADPRGRRR